MIKRQEAILCMVAAALLFCLTEICMKKINGDLNGIQVNATRYFLAGLCLLPWSRKQLAARHTRITGAQQKACFLLGFVGITIVGPLYQMAAVALGASHTAVIFSSTPLFITVLAALLLGTPITRNEIIALGLQVLAIGVLVDPFHMTMDPFGLLGLFICVLGYSLYAVGGKKLMPALGSVTVTAWTFLWSGLQLLALALCTHIPAVARFLTAHGLARYARISLVNGYTWANLPWVLVLYLGVTLVAVLCWFHAMEYGSITLGSLTYFIKPALSPVFAWLLLGEAITLSMAAGMALMLLGAGIALKK